MFMSGLFNQLVSAFPNLSFIPNYPLAQHTYFKIGGPAEVYASLTDKKDIVDVVTYCQQHQIKLTILGGSSNIVVADEGVSGLVLRMDFNQITDLDQLTPEGKHLIQAGAGVKTALLVSKTIELGYTGLEYFLGVPGTLGGAVYNNAHYLQDLIGTHINRVEIITENGETAWLNHKDCDFGYDSSRFQHTKEIIITVEFVLAVGDLETSRQLIKEATQYRATTQPLGLPSSGCIFQNVPNTPELKKRFPQFADRTHVPGGFLIDQAGLKQTKVGDIEVSDKHAAFFVNRGNGTAQDVKQLVQLVKERVKAEFGVELQEEVFYLS